MKRFLLFFSFVISLGLAYSNQSVAADQDIGDVKTTYKSVYWSDGDSGEIGKIRFRLSNVDAPETRSMKQRGGAKCEEERALGYEAKEFVVSFTKGKELRIAKTFGTDRYDRLVIDLEANGESVGAAAVQSGFLRNWPHKNGLKLTPKPDWCSSH